MQQNKVNIFKFRVFMLKEFCISMESRDHPQVFLHGSNPVRSAASYEKKLKHQRHKYLRPKTVLTSEEISCSFWHNMIVCIWMYCNKCILTL